MSCFFACDESIIKIVESAYPHNLNVTVKCSKTTQTDVIFLSSFWFTVSFLACLWAEPSADELRRLMMLHGGQFHVYYSRSKTTHIIANNLPNSKIKELKGEKVIRPEWITDRSVQVGVDHVMLIWYDKNVISKKFLCHLSENSIKAGHLLPYLQYQLYAKHKGPLFPGMTLRQTSEIAGPSQASVHHKLHLPPCSLQHSVLNHEQSSSSSCQNNSVPPPRNSRLHQGNIQPQSNQHNSAAHSVIPQPRFSDPRHGDPLHTFPYPKKHLHKPPQSTLQTPHPSLHYQRAGQPQPQISTSCSSDQVGCKEAESKMWVPDFFPFI